MKRIRILLLITHLGGGGAEQVAFLLARHLNPERFEIHLGLVTDDGPGAGPPPENVVVHRLGLRRVRQSPFRLLRLIWSIRPEIVLSGMAHLNQLVLLLKAFLPRNTSVLVRQNTTASLAAHSWLTRLLYRRLYIRADAVICQSGAMADDLRCNFQLPAEKLAILANPIDTGGIQALTSSQPSVWPAGAGPNLLSVGRLAPEKGLDILIHAFAAVCKHHPGARLTLLGTGPEEDSLRRLSLAQGLASSITFAGHVSNPASYYAGATLFVLASRYEGMPNALLEAAAGGLPIVSTPCCQGISSLLHDAPATWLSDSISSEALAESILTALRSVHRPSGAPLRFHHPFLEPFKLPAAIGSYEQLLLRTVAGGSA